MVISSGELMSVLIYLIVWGLIFGVLWWGLAQIALPEPFGKVARVVLVVLTVLVLLNLLLGFAGTPLIRWR